MRYPFFVYQDNIELRPIFPDLTGNPLALDLSVKGSFLGKTDPGDQVAIEEKIRTAFGSDYSWGISGYLEDRRNFLISCPQMVAEKRFFHLGLDVIVPAGTPLHTPLDVVVEDIGFEDGKWTYGNYVVLKYTPGNCEPFYSMFGHLKKRSALKAGDRLSAGTAFAEVGDINDNGYWFEHIHIQILTEKGMEEGWKFKGYCSREDLPFMPRICPDPQPLFVR